VEALELREVLGRRGAADAGLVADLGLARAPDATAESTDMYVEASVPSSSLTSSSASS
jgi:hypothetical protein